MAIHRSLIAIIAKKHPIIWEEIIGPLGPLRVIDRVALNPQPLPPVARRGEEAGLNPQPLPPAQYGALVASELVRAAGIAQLLRVPFDVVAEDICPPPKPVPPIPWPPIPWPPEPYPWRQGREVLDDDWIFEYSIGLAAVLEASAHSWQHLDGAKALEALHEAAFANAEQRVG